MQTGAEMRIARIADEGSFCEINQQLQAKRPFLFPDYEKKMQEACSSGAFEAVVTGTARIEGQKVCLGVMDAGFIMGSMGMAAGEKIARLFEYAEKKEYPVILFCASGGARMQEGIFSLLQMAKTSIAISRFQNKGGLYVSVLTNPTYGGVSASFAFRGDIVIAEPETMIGFAGRRVIEQTTGERLPEDFQTAEFWMEHGYLDMLVAGSEMRSTLGKLLKLHRRRKEKVWLMRSGRLWRGRKY